MTCQCSRCESLRPHKFNVFAVQNFKSKPWLSPDLSGAIKIWQTLIFYILCVQQFYSIVILCGKQYTDLWIDVMKYSAVNFLVYAILYTVRDGVPHGVNGCYIYINIY